MANPQIITSRPVLSSCPRSRLPLSSPWGALWCRGSGSATKLFFGVTESFHTSSASARGIGEGRHSSRRERSAAVQVMARKKSAFAELFANKTAERTTGPQRTRLVPTKITPRLLVPPGIPRPSYAESGNPPEWSDDPQIQDAAGIVGMRAAGRLAAEVRDFAQTLIQPGVTTDAIDKAVHEKILAAGAYPSPLNYGGFPKSVCTSVNECICHGIPDIRPLEDGDIINIDVTVFLNGYHGDTSKTFFCGEPSKEARQLVEVTKEALDRAIAICGPGVEFKRIGNIINDLADKYSYGVVRKYVGHGVGKIFHTGPAVLHYRNKERGTMVENQTFTIEPMLTMGNPREVLWPDKWTVVTADSSLAAQFEHTLLITSNGVEVLTADVAPTA
eukprot:TRINITY_DN26693_c0_g1_i1.p1 TRINITY_DN26693_c0_g1~~TRINITY_DN26693_c0_g1_i1.p1  ORF type:complete len:434 (-),score=30.45 TRINITY_DN26693_c0_g1_i1:378-1541(-)